MHPVYIESLRKTEADCTTRRYTRELAVATGLAYINGIAEGNAMSTSRGSVYAGYAHALPRKL